MSPGTKSSNDIEINSALEGKFKEINEPGDKPSNDCVFAYKIYLSSSITFKIFNFYKFSLVHSAIS